MEGKGSIIGGILLILLLATGTWYCVSNTVTCQITCQVSGHNFVPAHYEEWISYECMSRRKDGSCKMSMPVHHRRFVTDTWSLHWLSLDGRDDHWNEVPEAQYVGIKDGFTELHEHLRWKTCH